MTEAGDAPYAAFQAGERAGWGERAARYGEATARGTMQAIPPLLAAVHLSPGMRMLDVACGVGYACGAAASLEAAPTGADFAPGMIAAARARFPGLAFTEADAMALPFDDGAFDAVVCNFGLFHMTDPGLAIAEAFRVLRPGGRFAFSQWCAPADSPLFGALYGVLKAHADMTRADPAPDAFALSAPGAAQEAMAAAGFAGVSREICPTILRAPGGSFHDFFQSFGVRVPLILAAQPEPVRAAIRAGVDAAMARFASGEGYIVPAPSLIIAGERP